MKFTLVILGILLLLLPVRTIFAQNQEPSPTRSAAEYGIEPGLFYAGVDVLELLEGISAAGAAAVEDAYARGYKAGLLDAGPDAALWKQRALDALAAQMAAEGRERGAFGRGFLVGGGSGFVVGTGLGLALWLSAR